MLHRERSYAHAHATSFLKLLDDEPDETSEEIDELIDSYLADSGDEFTTGRPVAALSCGIECTSPAVGSRDSATSEAALLHLEKEVGASVVECMSLDDEISEKGR